MQKSIDNKNIDEFNESPINVAAVSDIANLYSDKLINTFETGASAIQLQDRLDEIGVGQYTKGINKEAVKNIVAAYGLFKIVQLMKGHIIKIGIIGAMAYIGLKNKDQIVSNFKSI